MVKAKAGKLYEHPIIYDRCMRSYYLSESIDTMLDAQ